MKFNEKINHKKGYRDRHPFIFKTKSPYVRKTFLYKRETHLPLRVLFLFQCHAQIRTREVLSFYGRKLAARIHILP